MSYLLTVGVYGLFALAFYALVVLGVSIFPDFVSLPAGFVTGVETVFAYLRGADFLLPMETLFQVFIFLLSFNVVLFIVKTIFWVIHLVRGSKK